MSKSILDDIDGIGKKRKQELLKTFGSIDKIKEADIEDIMKINGITRKIAENIKEAIK